MKILIIGLALILSACGMQGDLYLPDENDKPTKQEKLIKQEVKVIDN